MFFLHKKEKEKEPLKFSPADVGTLIQPRKTHYFICD